MITVIRDPPLWLFCYWKAPVTGHSGRSRQNDRFIVVIRTQCRFVLFPINHEKWLQAESSRFNTDLHVPAIIQIPIVFRYAEIPCLRPAVSSLGACPTPVR